MVWKFIPEQLQDLDTETEYFQGGCCDNLRKGQHIVVCWALATLYWTQFNTRLHPQGKEEENRPTGTAA